MGKEIGGLFLQHFTVDLLVIRDHGQPPVDGIKLAEFIDYAMTENKEERGSEWRWEIGRVKEQPLSIHNGIRRRRRKAAG